MKRKHKDELRRLRAEVDQARSEYLELVQRHERLVNSVSALKHEHEHLAASLAQRGIWNVGDYSKLKVVP